MAERLTKTQVKNIIKDVDNKMMELGVFRNAACCDVPAVERNIHRLGIVREALLALKQGRPIVVALEGDECVAEDRFEEFVTKEKKQ